jgi:5-formyltetrahydrofolate cyclo-ligase
MIKQEKEKVRRYYLNRRKKMSPDEIEVLSKSILQHLMGWEPVLSTDTVHCFMSISENREVDTGPIIQWLINQNKRVIIPKSVKKTRELEHIVFHGQDQLEVNEWGIPEPAGGERVSVSDLDLILVPMIAADKNKNRLGYGLGFYDRFLADVRALKVGLLFENCLSNEPLPVDKYDVQLDYLITEKGIY